MNQTPEDVIQGHWIGGFTRDGCWVYMDLHVTTSGQTPQVTVDLLPNASGGQVLTTLTVELPRIQLHVTGAGLFAHFAGEIAGNEIAGEMGQGTTQVPFRLARVAHAPFDFPSDLIGIYQLTPEHEVFIGNLFGSSIPAYYDFVSGHLRALFPLTRDRYFAGPALLMPFPTEVELFFTRNDQGNVTGFVWHQSGRADVIATRKEVVQEAVRFRNGEITLAGTLLLPPTRGPHPAVVLVHGSGPQTRHMVRLYADTFARHGIAALIYDKRGAGASTGQWNSGYEELAGDALAGIDYLRGHPAINPSQIGLCGGSQAGWVMPLVASRSQAIAFMIILAGPAVTIAQQNVHNAAYSLRVGGFSEEEVQAAVAHIKLFNRLLCTGEGWEEFQGSLAPGRQARWAAYAWSIDKVPSPAAAASIRAEMEQDPLPVLQQVRCPVLALFGTADTVVPVKENLPLIEQALATGDTADYIIQVIADATHTFMRSATGSDKEFPFRTRWAAEHMAVILEWLLKRVSIAET